MNTFAVCTTRDAVAPGIHLVSLVGEFDLHSAPQLKADLEGLLDDRPAEILVNLVGVDFIDSTALLTIRDAAKRGRRTGTTIVVAADDRNVRRLFELTAIGREADLHETFSDAVAAALGRNAARTDAVAA